MKNLFGIKKKTQSGAINRTINIYGGGSPVFSGRVSDLPINEKILLSKSVEFFSDPEPCYIHRSAVQARLYAEFEQWLDSVGAAETYVAELRDLPGYIRAYFFDGCIGGDSDGDSGDSNGGNENSGGDDVGKNGLGDGGGKSGLGDGSGKSDVVFDD